MSSLFDQFKMDGDAEVHGVLLDYGAAGRIRIARAGGSNKRYIKRVEAFQQKHQRQIDLKTIDNEVTRRALVEIFADTIILGWESGSEDSPDLGVIPGPDGQPLQYTRANVVMLLTELPDLFDEIREQSMKLVLFREAAKQADAGNS